jgi:ribosomal-protein-alanine N-acetyltransferase
MHMKANRSELKLNGVRIVLRELEKEDWAAVHEVANRHEVYQYQPWGPSTSEDTHIYLQTVLQTIEQQSRTEYTLAVEMRSTGNFIGYASLWLRNEQFRTGEIGYFLHPDYWGQGLGTETANLLIRSGFERFGLHRIYATSDPRNIRSKRVLEKTGMTYEGCLRHTMLLRDGWRDSDVYGILEHEWMEINGNRVIL